MNTREKGKKDFGGGGGGGKGGGAIISFIPCGENKFKNRSSRGESLTKERGTARREKKKKSKGAGAPPFLQKGGEKPIKKRKEEKKRESSAGLPTERKDQGGGCLVGEKREKKKGERKKKRGKEVGDNRLKDRERKRKDLFSRRRKTNRGMGKGSCTDLFSSPLGERRRKGGERKRQKGKKKGEAGAALFPSHRKRGGGRQRPHGKKKKEELSLSLISGGGEGRQSGRKGRKGTHVLSLRQRKRHDAGRGEGKVGGLLFAGEKKGKGGVYNGEREKNSPLSYFSTSNRKGGKRKG